jgi:tetratricopeptide (TPR) repeat protein
MAAHCRGLRPAALPLRRQCRHVFRVFFLQAAPAELRDVQAIVGLIRELADFEQLTHLLQVTPEKLRPHLFGEKPVAEALVAEVDGAEVVAFALFFTNFSTFLAQPGLYLEDLFVRPAHRGAGHRAGAAARLARWRGARLRPLRMVGAGLERQRHRFYERMGATVMPDWRICRVTGDALRDLARRRCAQRMRKAAVALLLACTVAQAAVDPDPLWDFANPAASEQRFRQALQGAQGDDVLVLRTQIARTHSLRRQFDVAHRELDALDPLLATAGAEPRVRAWLERGRTLRSAGQPAAAAPWFDKAFELADRQRLEFLAADALHMQALVAPTLDERVAINRRVVAYAQNARDPRARRWDAAALNNIGSDLNEAGHHAQALPVLREAQAAYERAGRPLNVLYARWAVGHTLRLLGRLDEALSAAARARSRLGRRRRQRSLCVRRDRAHPRRAGRRGQGGVLPRAGRAGPLIRPRGLQPPRGSAVPGAGISPAC